MPCVGKMREVYLLTSVHNPPPQSSCNFVDEEENASEPLWIESYDNRMFSGFECCDGRQPQHVL